MCPEGAAGDEPLRGSGRRPLLPAEKGVYAVCFRLEGPVEIRDRRGRVLAKAERGYLIYVGSAGGPGGIRARVSRHLRGPQRVWWHIDSVSSSPLARPVFIYYEVGRYGRPAEDGLASYIEPLEGLFPLGMAGATDSLRPHMFYCKDPGAIAEALARRGGTLWWCGDEGKGRYL
ncbi:MAG: DUF123 domain-containing protein [Acidianus sp.]|nr:DUF123 domain-containing protein [Acidianus sp.]